MSYASRSGRAVTSPTSPRAFGVCDRCGIWYNRDRLSNQMQWRGAQLGPTYLFVCPPCYDRPNENLRAIVLAPDPIPVYMPRTEPFLYDETTGQTQLIGQPVGLEQAAIMPLYGTTHYGVDIQPLSVISNGTQTVSVSCSAPHGLSTDDQIAAEGLSDVSACGFFSVSVTSATALAYVCYSDIAAGSLLTSVSKIVTALVGLPLGATTIPQVGP